MSPCNHPQCPSQCLMCQGGKNILHGPTTLTVSPLLQTLDFFPKFIFLHTANSILFQKSQRPLVLLSNFGLLVMAWILIFAWRTYGMLAVIKYYTIPWLCVTHWFVMITYVQHVVRILPFSNLCFHAHQLVRLLRRIRVFLTTADLPSLSNEVPQRPSIDHSSAGKEDFSCTMSPIITSSIISSPRSVGLIDRSFPRLIDFKIPWYNCEEATRHLKPVIGEHYRYEDKPVFKSLWDTYNACQFVDDDGRGYQLKVLNNLIYPICRGCRVLSRQTWSGDTSASSYHASHLECCGVNLGHLFLVPALY